MSAPAPATKAEIKEFTPSVVDHDDILNDRVPLPTPRPVERTPAPAPQPAPAPKVEPAPTLTSEVPDIDLSIAPKPKEPTAPEPAPGEPPAKKPAKPGDAMRQQMEKLSQEKKARDDEYEALKKAHEAREAEYEALKNSYSEREKEVNEFRSRDAIGNPMEHPDVKAIVEPWNAAARDFSTDAEAVTGTDSNEIFNKMLAHSQKLAKLEPGSAEYKEAMAGVRDDMSEQVGGENLMQALRLIRDGASRIPQIQQLVKGIKDDLPAFQYRQNKGHYDQMASEYSKVEANLFNPSQDIINNDPYHHSVILRAMIDGSEEVKKAAENAKAFSRMVLLPPMPLSPEDLADLPDGQREERVQQILGTHSKARNKLGSVLAEALLARQLLPALFKRMTEAEELLRGERGVIRPRLKAAKEPTATEPVAGEHASLADFTPDDAAVEEFKQGR